MLPSTITIKPTKGKGSSSLVGSWRKIRTLQHNAMNHEMNHELVESFINSRKGYRHIIFLKKMIVPLTGNEGPFLKASSSHVISNNTSDMNSLENILNSQSIQ